MTLRESVLKLPVEQMKNTVENSLIMNVLLTAGYNLKYTFAGDPLGF